MKMRLFAQLGELIAPEIDLELPVKFDRESLLSKLAEEYPLHASEIKKCNVAVNQAYIYDEKIDATDVKEIALIPPVSGG